MRNFSIHKNPKNSTWGKQTLYYLHECGIFDGGRLGEISYYQNNLLKFVWDYYPYHSNVRITNTSIQHNDYSIGLKMDIIISGPHIFSLHIPKDEKRTRIFKQRLK